MGAEIDGVYRSDAYELPISAIREMIANAVVHRSYLDRSCVQICIFDDRVEVLSPGMLYNGLDLETAKTGKSTCRNEAIAEAFHYMHIIEAWGTGIPRIINRCKEYGLAEPLFEEYGDGFKVTIFRKVVDAYEKMVNDPEKVVNAYGKVVNDPEKVVNVPEKVVDAPEKVVNDSEKIVGAFKKYIPQLLDAGVTEKYIENMELVFKECGVGLPFGQANVMEWLHCSRGKAINIMKAMKNAKVIRKVAGLGPGRYEFIEL